MPVIFCRVRSALAALAARDSSSKSWGSPAGSTDPYADSRLYETGLRRTSPSAMVKVTQP